ncbi:toxin-antitoxin system, antitoxin component, PHD family protein [Leptospira mayottensis]|uniref:toxin-antitoxin system, antitoxin component, PHD family protein n=1 Tax=Leptospira mayottensis TaxID=1137606 RepID=UPI000E35BD3C|nr:toxin-antitoxin system, antitoxin component, PHD family protein [Leptospira mayottensis]AXR68296.1 toxin-antitoxin system, antitoxin component, PHD family protein [Leptospira mayottensis]
MNTFLRLVKEGETILVTDHSRIIAEIKKPTSDILNSDLTVESYIEKEQKSGLLLKQKENPTVLKPPSKVKEKFQLDWMKTYYEDRD